MKPKSLRRNTCELLGLSPLSALKEGGFAFPTVAIKAILFCSIHPSCFWSFSFKPIPSVFVKVSFSGLSSYVVLCSEFASHLSTVSQPFPSPSFHYLYRVQHIDPCFLLSPVVQPDWIILLVSRLVSSFSPCELVLCCIFSPSPLLLHSVHYFFVMLFLSYI